MRSDGEVIITTKLDTKSFEKQIAEVEYELAQIDYELSHAKELKLDSRTISEYTKRAEVLNNRLIDLKKRQEDLDKQGFNNLSNSISGISESLSGIIKKVTKWGLAVFGVRSAYMFIRRSISTLSQYNEQMAADIQYITYALATTLQPLIEGLINLVYKLLAYVNYIANAWFGINLFANASAKAFNKANTNANALKKTLASFDELNILNDNNDGISGGLLPSFDLSKLRNIEIPEWVRWIADHKDLFKLLGEVLLVAFGTRTIAKVLSNIAMLFGASGGMGLIGLSEILLAIAAPIIIYFDIKQIGKVIQETKKVKSALEANTKASEELTRGSKEYLNTLQEKLKAGELDNEQIQNSTKYLIEHNKNQKQLIELTQSQENWWTRITGVSKETTKQYENMKKEILNNINAFELLNQTGQVTEQQQKDFYDALYNNIIALEKVGINTDDLREAFEKLSSRKFTIGIDAKESQSALEKVLGLLDKIFGTKWSINTKIGIGFSGGGGSGHGFAKGGIVYHNLPKLASGGIINLPGRGVPIGSAIVGERGKEGVLPLTDSQQMELLGEAIGKYININATVPVYVGNRQIAKEIRKINAENDFAFNR